MLNELAFSEKKETMRQRIFADRIKLLNQNLLFSIPANFFCSALVFFGLYDLTNPTWLFAWFATGVIVSALRCGLFFFIRSNSGSLVLNIRLLIAGTTVSAALWGVAGTLLMPQQDLLHQMMLIIVIIGVASGGLHTLQASAQASCLFFTLTIAPLNLWFFFQADIIYLLLGLALLIYLGFMLVVSWHGYRLLSSNLKLRYKNLDLIDQLSQSNVVLKESESCFHSAFDFAAIGMALVSLEGRWLKVNKSLCHIVGYSEEELLEIDFQKITYPEDLELDLNYVRQLLAGKITTYQMEKRYICKDSSIIWVLLSGSLIRDVENNPLYFIAQIQNIDSQKRVEQELKYIAYHDVLTGLSNRKQLDVSFEFALAYAKRHKTHIAILFMDLDYFKEVNDQYGHEVGDLLLIETASRLQASLRSSDILARLGGDEFIMGLTEVSDLGPVSEVIKKILSSIAKPIRIKQHRILITSSIGVSLYPEDGQDLNTLIKKADNALYHVKSEGRNNFILYQSRPTFRT